MTQNGKAFELPTLEQLTNVSASSSSPILRTPAASEAERGHQTESVARARGGQVTLSGQMLELFPTTRVSMANGPTRKEIEQGNPKGRIETEVMLFPTPNTMEHREIKTPEQIQAMKDKSPGGYRNLRESVVNEMPTLPTPTVSQGRNETSGRKEDSKHHSGTTLQDIAYKGSWGRFEPAIRRWEQTLGRPAPAPTKPDGKDGGNRLSSLFTEWLMGLPEGWITGLGLKRTDELKLAGNGVVPQQAELALRLLLEDDNLLERIKK